MASKSPGSSPAQAWDHTVDVLVVGSGAGAMVAALTAHDGGASTLLIEKCTDYGGSSARSGGGMWIPNNHLMRADGVEDSTADTLAYLKAVIGEGVEPEDRLEAFVNHAPEMLEYLCNRTRVKVHRCASYPDYHPSKPGWRIGRTVESDVFDARPLGDDLLLLHKPPTEGVMDRYHITITQVPQMLFKKPGWKTAFLKIVLRYWLDVPWRFKSKRSRDLTLGLGLIASLRLSLKDRNIPLWLNTPVRELVQENGRVVGVVATREGKRIRIRAKKGVVLSTGGFEGSQALREKYLPNPTDAAWACGNPANIGDAIALGQSVGAKLGLMNYFVGMPVDMVPGLQGGRGKIIERAAPGTIIVNKRGARFMNESLPYVNAVEAIYANNLPEASTVPAYMIFDGGYREKYSFGPVMPSSVMPDSKMPKGYLHKGETLDELARKLGIDAAGLKATAAKVTEYARTGVDLDFHRGDSAYDRYMGDPRVKPNVNLGPVEKPPFYGVEIYPGDLGTTGGLRTDAHARVLNEQGAVIPGLYAIGNCSASAIAGTYPGPGATLGPATTFGYIAARHLTAATGAEETRTRGAGSVRNPATATQREAGNV